MFVNHASNILYEYRGIKISLTRRNDIKDVDFFYYISLEIEDWTKNYLWRYES